MRVELIYDADCPNVEAAREQLRKAFQRARAEADWKEWNRSAPGSPAYVQQYGSPTVLVDGRDVAGVAPSDGSASCRIYVSSSGEMGGVPPVEMIAQALSAVPRQRAGWRGLLSVVPGVGASLLPVGACPACWPVYAGLLSALGLGFLLETRYLFPVTAALLGIALLSLGYRAHSRRGYQPLVLGALGVAVALGGKFLFLSNAALYAGLGILVLASLWNSWPRKGKKPGSCPACVPGADATRTQDA